MGNLDQRITRPRLLIVLVPVIVLFCFVLNVQKADSATNNPIISFAGPVLNDINTNLKAVANSDTETATNEGSVTTTNNSETATTNGGSTVTTNSTGDDSSTVLSQSQIKLKVVGRRQHVYLSWSQIKRIKGYYIYRKEGSGAFDKINSSPIIAIHYYDIPPKGNVEYIYYITAVSSTGTEFGKSNEATGVYKVSVPKEIPKSNEVTGDVPFKDIPSDAWYRKSVSILISKKIISGYPDGLFKPNNSVTRAEFAKMICSAMGWTIEKPLSSSYGDISPNYWGFQYIETAKKQGAISGYPDGAFYPEKQITRAEIATVSDRVLAQQGRK